MGLVTAERLDPVEEARSVLQCLSLQCHTINAEEISAFLVETERLVPCEVDWTGLVAAAAGVFLERLCDIINLGGEVVAHQVFGLGDSINSLQHGLSHLVMFTIGVLADLLPDCSDKKYAQHNVDGLLVRLSPDGRLVDAGKTWMLVVCEYRINS